MVGKDAVPEFEAKTLPPGSAPSSKTFAPNTSDVQADPSQINTEAQTAAAVPGSTSGDVHTGLGHPGSGMTSQELHNKTQQRQGVEGAGARGVLQSGIDTSDPKFAEHRTLGSDVAETGRGNVGGPSAEDRVPVGAEGVASERK